MLLWSPSIFTFNTTVTVTDERKVFYVCICFSALKLCVSDTPTSRQMLQTCLLSTVLTLMSIDYCAK